MSSLQNLTDVANIDTDVTDIKAVTDLIPDNGAMLSIAQSATVALDATVAKEATLLDVQDEVNDVEQHIHNITRAAGLRVPQTATLWADFATLTPYVLTSGNNDWGLWIQLIGSGDTPVIAGKTHYDPQLIGIPSGSDNTPYRIQFAYGSGTPAEALAADQYSEDIVTPVSAPGPVAAGIPFDVSIPRLVAGTKMWARCWNAGNGETLNIFVHTHEYPAGP